MCRWTLKVEHWLLNNGGKSTKLDGTRVQDEVLGSVVVSKLISWISGHCSPCFHRCMHMSRLRFRNQQMDAEAHSYMEGRPECLERMLKGPSLYIHQYVEILARRIAECQSGRFLGGEHCKHILWWQRKDIRWYALVESRRWWCDKNQEGTRRAFQIESTRREFEGKASNRREIQI